MLARLAVEGSRSWSPVSMLIATIISVGMFDIAISPTGTARDSSSTNPSNGRRVVYLLPLTPGRTAPPRAEALHWSTLASPTRAGPTGTGTPRHGGTGGTRVPVLGPSPVRVPQPGDGGRVYIESEMGRPVRRDPSSAAPAYPEFLQHEGIEGNVLVEYIVDTTGLADSASLRVVRASNPAFAESVRAALPGMRFEPGEVGGRLVRQLVAQEFRFIISLPVVATPSAKAAKRHHH